MKDPIIKTQYYSYIISLLAAFALFLPAVGQAKFIAVSANQNDSFQNLILSSLDDYADTLGDTTYIDYANTNTQTQLDQLKSYMKVGADALVVNSADSANTKLTYKILEIANGKPVVFYNSEPLPDLTKLPKNAVYVGSNELDSGTMQMEELARLAHYKGKVALLIGEPKHHAAITRTQDVKNVINKYPNMTLVTSKVANWSRTEAYAAVSQWIKDKVDFNILVANNDEMIVGAILAFEDAGIDPKPYLLGGIDATQDALHEMAKGNLDVTVLQDAKNQGRAAVNVAYKLMNGQKIPPTYWVPFKLVTPDNYQQYLKK